MANQKSYSIVINGVKESINEIDILINQLETLEKKINGLSKQGIKIDTKGLEKIKIPEISIDSINAKGLQKEMKELEKDIAKGAKTIDGEYTNTLAGLRAQLRDMKKELSTLDLDVDADAFADLTDDIKELNDRVKEMEQDYGTFSRNVGNYTESVVDALNEFDGQVYETVDGVKEVTKSLDGLKDKQNINIQIGDEVVQFETLSQAIGEIDDMAQSAAAKMQQLAAAGKENTDEYKQLNEEFQIYIQQAAELERARKYSDELKDSLASTTRGLDIAVQSFQALGNAMQMASGIAGLFGQEQEEIEKSINRTVQIMAILQAAQELYQQTVQQGTVLNRVWNVSLAASEKVMKMLGVTTNTTSKAMKGLKYAIAATGIGILVVLLGEVINMCVDWATSLNKAEKDLVNTANKLDRFTESTKAWLSEVERLNNLKVKLSLLKELESVDDMLQRLKANYTLTLNDISHESKKFSGKWADLLSIDTKNLEKDKSKIVLILSQLSFEYTQNKEIVDKYKSAVNEASNELDEETIKSYNNAQAKVVLYDTLSQLIEGYAEYTNAVKDNQEKVDEVNRKIKDNRIAVMKDGFSKEQALRDEQQKREIEDAKKTGIRVQEQIKSINEKYKALNKKALEDYRKEVSDLKYDIEKSLVLDSMNIDANILSEAITNTYRHIDKLSEKITNFRKDWLSITDNSNLENAIPNNFGTEQLSTFKKFTLKIKDFWKENVVGVLSGKKIEANIDKLTERISTLKDEVFNGRPMDKSVMDYLEGYDKLEKDSAKKQLNQQRLSGQISEEEFKKAEEAIDKHYKNRERLFKEYSSREIGLVLQVEAEEKRLMQQEQSISLREEEIRYNEELKKLAEAQEKQLERTDLTEKERKGIIEYWDKQCQLADENHQKNLTNIRLTYANKQIEIEKNTQMERSNIITHYNDIIYEEYKKGFEEIEDLREKFSNVDEVDLGSNELSIIGSFSSSIMEMGKFKDSFSKMKDNIKQQKQELIKQFSDGVITEEAFNKSYAELNTLEKEVNDSLSSVSLNLKEWAVGAADIVNAAVGIWAQMFSQIADLQYQNEMYRIEQLREQYDEETEILQEKLEEQEALYEKHNQNVSDIEGELQTARGDRRLFLLDQINSEMQKREQAWAQEQKIQKQQEALEKKKKALEDREKAAEQKRNKQNQKVQIAQATASTALAVTNALAVQPWFLGVALAAVAAAMGAVQIATIAKQKFADGGIIQGNSHAQGGVKVLGGQAEVEGGEFITNKVTTSKNADVLTFINSNKRKLDLSDFVEFYSTGSKSYSKSPKTIFADGGQLPTMKAPEINVKDVVNNNNQDNRPIYVSVTEIENVQNKVRNVRAIAGLE
jgi:chromosome segregation ATPase